MASIRLEIIYESFVQIMGVSFSALVDNFSGLLYDYLRLSPPITRDDLSGMAKAAQTAVIARGAVNSSDEIFLLALTVLTRITQSSSLTTSGDFADFCNQMWNACNGRSSIESLQAEWGEL